MQVDSTTATAASQPPAHHLSFDGPRGQEILKALADKLGMQPDDLKAQLDAGKSLRDLASAQGLSMHDLFAAVRQAVGAPQNADGAQAAHGHHHPHHGGGGSVDSKLLDAISQKLGMSTTDLTSALQSGQGLLDIARSKGVSEDDLVQTMQQAFQQLAPYGQGDTAGTQSWTQDVTQVNAAV